MEGAWICSICQFSWCKDAHQGQFQVGSNLQPAAKTPKIQELAITPLDFASIYFSTSFAAVEHKQ